MPSESGMLTPGKSPFSEWPTYTSNLCPIRRSGAAVRQDHARPFCTVRARTARGFLLDLTAYFARSARRGLRGLSLVRQLERKEEMKAYPSDLRYFVKRTASIKRLAVLKRRFAQRSTFRGLSPNRPHTTSRRLVYF